MLKSSKKNSIEVKIFDPYFNDVEINELVGVGTFNFPSGLNEFDAVIVSVDHNEFKDTANLMENLNGCKYILDNLGIWDHVNFSDSGIDYHISGDSNWI